MTGPHGYTINSCPDAPEQHTTMQSSYIGWDRQAEALDRAGATQVRCPTCDLWAQWRGADRALIRNAADWLRDINETATP